MDIKTVGLACDHAGFPLKKVCHPIFGRSWLSV